MTKKQYLAALKKLSLLPHGLVTARVLGVKRRQIQKYAAGEVDPVPETLAKLVTMYLKYGIPREFLDQP
jgi:transcriptional regulator with XRE-family HTH domain